MQRCLLTGFLGAFWITAYGMSDDEFEVNMMLMRVLAFAFNRFLRILWHYLLWSKQSRATGAHWCIGSLVHWFIGALVHWFIGSLVHWCIGAYVHWCIRAYVHWCIGHSS